MTTADQLVNSADAATNMLRGRVALVTGATSGIGRAIALALAAQGARPCFIGRSTHTLENVLQLARNDSPHARMYRVDLTREEDIRALVADVDRDYGRIDILVHCAGAISHGEHANVSVSELDSLYHANVRGPYLLTQLALPLLRVGPGQIVFVNSSSGLKARARAGQFSATQHAMKAIADSLRDEVNADGIRVLSVFPGRTATPRTEKLFHEEGRAYRPELLMQPEDVATMVLHAISLPRSAEVTEIAMRPLYKSY
jgi:NAD(P)-dependent dehydrogenase (short-subunit alcohol dehydrogenase family)